MKRSTREERLLAVLAQMRAVAVLHDKEVAHSQADGLLEEALRIMGERTTMKEIVGDVLGTYAGVVKWCA